MWARLPDPDETESGDFSFLLVVVAARSDGSWPILDPIFGSHFERHFWTPLLDPILENAEKWPPEGPRADLGPQPCKVSKQNCLGATILGSPPKSGTPFWTPFLDTILDPIFGPHFWTPCWTPFWSPFLDPIFRSHFGDHFGLRVPGAM